MSTCCGAILDPQLFRICYGSFSNVAAMPGVCHILIGLWELGVALTAIGFLIRHLPYLNPNSRLLPNTVLGSWDFVSKVGCRIGPCVRRRAPGIGLLSVGGGGGRTGPVGQQRPLELTLWCSRKRAFRNRSGTSFHAKLAIAPPRRRLQFESVQQASGHHHVSNTDIPCQVVPRVALVVGV